MDMNLLNIGASAEGKMRIIQETVPGKQVTLAHIIASPGEIIYQKLGLNPELDYKQSAIGILSMCPSEISVIAGHLAFCRCTDIQKVHIHCQFTPSAALN